MLRDTDTQIFMLAAPLEHIFVFSSCCYCCCCLDCSTWIWFGALQKYQNSNSTNWFHSSFVL